MANTYSWDCSKVETYPIQGDLADVVFRVHWQFTGLDESGQHSYTVSGAESIDVDPDNFTAFDDLTAEIVTGWVTSAIGEQGVSELMSHVDAQISERMAPLTVLRTIG